MLSRRSEVEPLHHPPSEQHWGIVITACVDDQRRELQTLPMLDRHPAMQCLELTVHGIEAGPGERAERIEVEGAGLAAGDGVAELRKRTIEHASDLEEPPCSRTRFREQLEETITRDAWRTAAAWAAAGRATRRAARRAGAGRRA